MDCVNNWVCNIKDVGCVRLVYTSGFGNFAIVVDELEIEDYIDG